MRKMTKMRKDVNDDDEEEDDSHDGQDNGNDDDNTSDKHENDNDWGNDDDGGRMKSLIKMMIIGMTVMRRMMKMRWMRLMLKMRMSITVTTGDDDSADEDVLHFSDRSSF